MNWNSLFLPWLFHFRQHLIAKSMRCRSIETYPLLSLSHMLRFPFCKQKGELTVLRLMEEHWHRRLGFLNPFIPINKSFSSLPKYISQFHCFSFSKLSFLLFNLLLKHRFTYCSFRVSYQLWDPRKYLRSSCCILGDLRNTPWISPWGQWLYTPQEVQQVHVFIIFNITLYRRFTSPFFGLCRQFS